MTRKFLLDLGLEKDVISAIMDENGKDIEREKGKFETLKADFKDLQNDNKELKAQADKSSEIDVKETEEYKTLLNEFEAYKGEITGKETKANQLKELRTNLEKEGASPNSIDLMVEIYANSESIPETALDDLKGKFSGHFGEVVEKGGGVATPPANNVTAGYTMDDIKGMTPDQINANWDKVQQTLKKGE